MSSKNEKDIKSLPFPKKARNASFNGQSMFPTLHNKINLFNSQIMKSNITKLKDSLSEKNDFLSKYEENKIKKVNDFIFNPNINYDIETSKLQKISDVKGINWNANSNENFEKGKGLGIIKLKQSRRDVTKFNTSYEKNKAKKKVNFKEEDIKGSEKKENSFVPKKLVSDRHIFHMHPMGRADEPNDDRVRTPKRIKIIRKPTLQEILSPKKERVQPENREKTNLFISHFLKKVDSPSPRKKRKSISLITGTQDIKESFKSEISNFNLVNNYNNNNNNYYNENSESSIDNSNNNKSNNNKFNNFELENKSGVNKEKNLIIGSNINQIKSKSFKYDRNQIAEEPAEKSDDSDNDEKNSFEKKVSILDQSSSSIGNSKTNSNGGYEKIKSEEKSKIKNFANLNFEEKLNSESKNINQLYLNDFLTSSPTKSAIGDSTRKPSGLLSFANVKNNILSSFNLNNLDLKRKEDKNYVATRLSTHIFGVRDSKLTFNTLFQSENNVNANFNSNNNYNYEADSYNNSINNKENLFNFEIRNSKLNGEQINSTNSKIMANLNNNIKNENLQNATESPKSSNNKGIKSPKRNSKAYNNTYEIDNKSGASSPINLKTNINKSPIAQKFTMGYDHDKLPILNKMKQRKNNEASSPKLKQSFNLLSYKNVKNNIIPTLSNEEEVLSSGNYNGLKRSNTLAVNNILNYQNTNSFHNKMLNKFNLNKSNNLSPERNLSSGKSSGSSESSASSTHKSFNSEPSVASAIETFSDSDAEEIKKEEKDKIEVNLIDNKILEQLKMLQKITIESPKKKANKRKFTIYDKNVLKFFDKEIRNEKHHKDVENVYGKVFGQNLEKILELRKYPARVENQTKANKNIDRRKFAEKNYVNKYICDMKEKIHFMKGLLDFSYAKIICDKVRVIGDNVKRRHLKEKLKKIRKLNENEMQEVISHFNDLKYLDVGELVTDSENEVEENIVDKSRSNLKNSNSINPIKPKKHKTVEKIFSQLKLKLEQLDKRLTKSLREVNNQSIQSYLKETKIIANRSDSTNSYKNNNHYNFSNNNNFQNEKKANNQKIKFANLFESLPKFNNTNYKQNNNSGTPQPPTIHSSSQHIINLDVTAYAKSPKLPLIGNASAADKFKGGDSVRKSIDFAHNTTEISYLGNYFSSTIKANNLSNLQVSDSNYHSNQGSTLNFNTKKSKTKAKLSKNNSQMNLKNIKSCYAENFKSKYSIFKDLKIANNISSDSVATNKNTIIDKIGDYKKTVREITNKHYLSTEYFNQISPRRANFNNAEANEVN